MSNAKRKEITLGEGGQVKSFLAPKDMVVGQELTGIYRGTFQTNGNFGPQIVHKIETADGAIGVNGNGMLNKKLAQVAEGTAVTIVYNGKETIKKGEWKGTKAFQFSVFADVPEGADTTGDADADADSDADAEGDDL